MTDNAFFVGKEIDYGAVRVAVHVARAIEKLRRLNSLTWSHHQAVASLEATDQDRLLPRQQ
jgi:hypothetical protein